jgi:hypothetical protein
MSVGIHYNVPVAQRSGTMRTATMSKADGRKPNRPASSGAGGEEADDRITPISYRPAADVWAAMNAFRERQNFPPGKSVVIDRALRAFLRANGFPALAERAGADSDRDD